MDEELKRCIEHAMYRDMKDTVPKLKFLGIASKKKRKKRGGGS